MNSPSVVAIVRAQAYESAGLEAAVRQALKLIGGLPASLRPGCRILVKINHLSPPSPAERGIVTHPAFTGAVLSVLKETGADITVGDDIEENGEDGFMISGYRQMCGELGVELINLRESGFAARKTGGKVLSEIYIARAVLEADVIINLAKFKTHSLTLFTGGIKNMYGVIPAGMRRRFHGDHVRPEDFAGMLVDIFAAVPPHLTLLDGVYAMEGEGPGSGRMRNLGVILASRDTVALDATACRIIGIPPDEVLPTVLAAARGLGATTNIKVVGEQIESVAVKDFKLPLTVSRRLMKQLPGFLVKSGVSQISPRPVVDRKNCTACVACEQACPTGAARVAGFKTARIDYAKCIRCMCCHEVCRYDAILPRRPFFGQGIYGIISMIRQVKRK